MAYNLRSVIDVSNKLQGMPPAKKTFGYGLCLAKGIRPEGTDVVSGAFTSVNAIAEVFGSNAEVVKQAQTYFSGGWFGKPYELYVAYADTETMATIEEWTTAQVYEVGTKVKSGDNAYICSVAHTSSGEFGTAIWKNIEEEQETEWESETEYNTGDKVSVLVDGETKYFECIYSHTSPSEFSTTCWDAYVPTGKSISEWMDDFLADSKNFYVFLPTTEFSTDELVDIASKVESSTNPKLCIATYSDADAYATTETSDLGSVLKELGYDRTMVIYEPKNSYGEVKYVSSAVLSAYATVSFTNARPSITMADKKLNGVNALDLKDAQYGALQSKNYNFYTKTTDIDTDMFIDARMSSGQFFDTIQGADWLAYEMKYQLVNLVQNRDKIPFTEDGLALVKQTLSQVCLSALNAGLIGTGKDQDGNIIENGFLIQMPELADIPNTDKARRILRDVKITFILSGAIQVINVLNDIQL